MAKEKVLSEMSKTEILEYAIIRAASVSEMIFQSKGNIKTVEVDNEERMRRFNIADELMIAIFYLYDNGQSEEA